MSGETATLILDGVEITTARSVRLEREPQEPWKLTIEFYLGSVQVEQLQRGSKITAVTTAAYYKAVEKRVEEMRAAQFKAPKG